MQNFDFKGFLAWLIKLITPMLSDEKVLQAASWLILEVLKRAVVDPEKRGKIIDMARDLLDRAKLIIDAVDAGDVPVAFWVK
jgi:hypothetical protein